MIFVRKVVGRLRLLLPGPRLPTQIRIGHVIFPLGLEYNPPTRSTREMFHGSYQVSLAHFIRSHTKPGDVFIDVGASIGYISAIALDRVGETGEVHAFEPVPWNLDRLADPLRANPRRKLIIQACALGDREGMAEIDALPPTYFGWHSLISGMSGHPDEVTRLPVRLGRLDTYIEKMNIPRVALIKIDVEGYEFPVLKGLERFLRSAPFKPTIVCEITPWAYPRLGLSLGELDAYMKGFGFKAHDIAHPGRKVHVARLNNPIDVVWTT